MDPSRLLIALFVSGVATALLFRRYSKAPIIFISISTLVSIVAWLFAGYYQTKTGKPWAEGFWCHISPELRQCKPSPEPQPQPQPQPPTSPEDEEGITEQNTVSFCKRRIEYPDKYEEEVVTVAIQQAYVTPKPVPPVFEAVDRAVVIQEASTNGATFVEEVETITVQESAWEWVNLPVDGFITSVRNANFPKTGVVKQYDFRSVVTDIPVVEQRKIPPVTRQVVVRKVEKPGPEDGDAVPAITQNYPLRKVSEPATTKKVNVPAIYTDLVHRYKVNDAYAVDILEVCNDTEKRKISENVTLKLMELGLIPQEELELSDDQIIEAIAAFQKNNDMPTTGTITVETLKRLAVPFRQQ